MTLKQDALRYHKYPRPGKIEVVPSKPCFSQGDLSLAYTPGVAIPCLEIQKNPECSFDYTARSNLVGVISNGSAVLGLGNIGALASKPVMEGKGVLFKRFADLDVFDLEINTSDPDEFINTVASLEPTFGGINLEDIKAPDCFYIEEELIKRMSIPVFHDDQHGTAIISSAALLNACEITGRTMADLRIVVNGAGAAAMACARMYVSVGVSRENISMVDSRGVIYKGRTEGMNSYKEAFALETQNRTLEDAVRGSNVLVGLSVKAAFSSELLLLMADNPIIFPLANPYPEISYEEARAARPDALVATGRSDYPNQVNNVLGFPFIFRGALDVRATTINNAMKIAAVKALAQLAREDVPDSVIRAYGGKPIRFGPEYIIPKPLDTRVLLTVAPAVARAAVESGVARIDLGKDQTYADHLEATLGPEREIMRKIAIRAQHNPKRIVLPDGNHPVILRAAYEAAREGICHPLLLGDEDEITSLARKLRIPLEGIEVKDHLKSPLRKEFAKTLFQLRCRKGWSLAETERQLRNRHVFGAMMVYEGLVDGQVNGINCSYPDAIRPVLRVIPRRKGVKKVSGVYLMVFKNQTFFFADPTVNFTPSSEDLAEIAILTGEMARFFDISPKVAMISFSNFGSTVHPDAQRVKAAVSIARERAPELMIDGEMQADTAVVGEILAREYPFSRLDGPANVLIFPGLTTANVAYKLLSRLGGAKAVGPLLMGVSKPFNVLHRDADMENVVHVIAITVAQAQDLEG
ncbi:MAG: NADP-dependent malic enzyme [Deltaproteobacteria bacterium]|nr:NADP-dependent malic enzyme [Deltaproteobacteria bacterium]